MNFINSLFFIVKSKLKAIPNYDLTARLQPYINHTHEKFCMFDLRKQNKEGIVPLNHRNIVL